MTPKPRKVPKVYQVVPTIVVLEMQTTLNNSFQGDSGVKWVARTRPDEKGGSMYVKYQGLNAIAWTLQEAANLHNNFL